MNTGRRRWKVVIVADDAEADAELTAKRSRRVCTVDGINVMYQYHRARVDVVIMDNRLGTPMGASIEGGRPHPREGREGKGREKRRWKTELKEHGWDRPESSSMRYATRLI